ncbi:unnamed protein product [Cyclocybe aegerita]|uniref:Uncharacterized protein n=1 Tax=Cyclocybe aegerita TaxID=1973307 RepID=A0A8S0WFW4_CYCAE|nr:unnamed protein product [Cyclocybe aegerita]
MGPPRRHPPPATTIPHMSSQSSLNQQDTDHEGALSETSKAPPRKTMTAKDRYDSNLKVLKRRDPSIQQIIDQFSHVCIYHHDGEKWYKHGYEGSMFLFERDSYPPYGFYVMNRVGMDDFIQRLYPEDDVIDMGKVFIIRSYPDFLSNRLTSIRLSKTESLPDKFSDVYAIPNIESIEPKAKGRASIIGLWIHATDARKTMVDVMCRLHSYIKKNLPYPDQYRRVPGQQELASASTTDSETSDSRARKVTYDSENDHSDAPSASSVDKSALDHLFSRLSKSVGTNPMTSTTHTTTVPTSQNAASQPTNLSMPTGKALLDTIFASAMSTPASPTSPSAYSHDSSGSHHPSTLSSVLAPHPSTSRPQVLTTQVLSTILTGSVPARAPSAASTSRSHPSAHEGDKEDNDSRSMFLEPDESDPESHSGPSVARLAGTDLLNTLGLGGPRPAQKINGDVTPRPPLNGGQRTQYPFAIEPISSISTVRGVPTGVQSTPSHLQPESKPRANRALVPFEPDSELWPYSRGNAVVAEDSSPTSGDDEIVELNFEETSVLSDPEAFKKVLQSKRSAVSLRTSQSNASLSTNGHGRVHVNGASPPSEEKEKSKGRRNRRSKKERDAKAKEAIEQSWDFPPPSPAASNASHTSQSLMSLLNGEPASPSPCPSPELPATTHKPSQASIPIQEMKTPTMTARATLAGNTNTHYVNGNGLHSVKGKERAVNGFVKHNSAGTGAFAEEMKETFLGALGAPARPNGRLEKNEFVRGVMDLIHDAGFMENLYQSYLVRHT